MLKFKQFILERRRATPQIKAWLSDRAKPYQYWMSKQFTLPFPLSKPMLDRMQNVNEDALAFHVTDIDGIATLYNLQNSSKSLSVTTQVSKVDSGMDMLMGVETAGGILAEVRGDVIFEGGYDIFSSPDSQGRRWIDLNQFASRMTKVHGNNKFLYDWDLTQRKIIMGQATDFYMKNRKELEYIYEEFYAGSQSDAKDLMKLLSHVGKDFEKAKLFWVGGQGYMVHVGSLRMSKEESMNERGIVDKIERVHGSNHPLIKKAKQGLFKLTKELFDEAERYFTDNLLDFFDMTAGPTNAYNEHIMTNFTIENVYFDIEEYTASDIEAEIGQYMSREEIEANGWSKEQFQQYFQKKWVAWSR